MLGFPVFLSPSPRVSACLRHFNCIMQLMYSGPTSYAIKGTGSTESTHPRQLVFDMHRRTAQINAGCIIPVPFGGGCICRLSLDASVDLNKATIGQFVLSGFSLPSVTMNDAG